MGIVKQRTTLKQRFFFVQEFFLFFKKVYNKVTIKKPTNVIKKTIEYLSDVSVK